jgi:hypothetical protein
MTEKINFLFFKFNTSNNNDYPGASNLPAQEKIANFKVEHET